MNNETDETQSNRKTDPTMMGWFAVPNTARPTDWLSVELESKTPDTMKDEYDPYEQSGCQDGYTCSQCGRTGGRSNILWLKDGVALQYESCDFCDYLSAFAGNLIARRLKDDLIPNALMARMQAGLGTERSFDGLKLDTDGSVKIPASVINRLWNAVQKIVVGPGHGENAFHQGMSELELGIKYFREIGWPSCEGEFNRQFRWPLRILQSDGRVCIAGSIYRYK